MAMLLIAIAISNVFVAETDAAPKDSITYQLDMTTVVLAEYDNTILYNSTDQVELKTYRQTAITDVKPSFYDSSLGLSKEELASRTKYLEKLRTVGMGLRIRDGTGWLTARTLSCNKNYSNFSRRAREGINS